MGGFPYSPVETTFSLNNETNGEPIKTQSMNTTEDTKPSQEPNGFQNGALKPSGLEHLLRPGGGGGVGRWRRRGPLVCWSGVILVLLVVGSSLVYHLNPDTSTILGYSRTFSTLHKFSMNIKVFTTPFFMLALLITSPRLVHLLNLLQEVCGHVHIVWRPRQHLLFLTFNAILLLCKLVTLVFTYAAANTTHILKTDVYTMTCAVLWAGYMAVTKVAVVDVMYISTHIIAQSFNCCILSEAVEDPMGNTATDIHDDDNQNQTTVPVNSKKKGLTEPTSPCSPHTNKSCEVTRPIHKLGFNARTAEEQSKSGSMWAEPSLTESSLIAACERLYQLNECQRAMNEYFCWPLIIILVSLITIITETIFYITCGPTITFPVRLILVLYLLDGVATFCFVCCTPGQLLKEVRGCCR